MRTHTTGYGSAKRQVARPGRHRLCIMSLRRMDHEALSLSHTQTDRQTDRQTHTLSLTHLAESRGLRERDVVQVMDCEAHATGYGSDMTHATGYGLDLTHATGYGSHDISNRLWVSTWRRAVASASVMSSRFALR